MIIKETYLSDCIPGWPYTHYTTQIGFQLAAILLPLLPRCWGYRHVPSHLALFSLNKNFKFREISKTIICDQKMSYQCVMAIALSLPLPSPCSRGVLCWSLPSPCGWGVLCWPLITSSPWSAMPSTKQLSHLKSHRMQFVFFGDSDSCQAAGSLLGT